MCRGEDFPPYDDPSIDDERPVEAILLDREVELSNPETIESGHETEVEQIIQSMGESDDE